MAYQLAMPDLLLDIEIAASPERVWSVLTDFAAYPVWNPYQTFEGRAEPFAIVQISSRDLTGRALQVFNAAIWKLEPSRKLELLVGKLFWLASRRIFHLDAVGDGMRLRHGLVFSGIASAWMSPSAQEMESLRPLYVAFGAALKRRAEESTRAPPAKKSRPPPRQAEHARKLMNTRAAGQSERR